MLTFRMSAIRLASSFRACVLVAGCAGMNRNECLSANWYAVGLEDGARGQPLERLGTHRRACAEHGVAPDAERYVAGRNEGLKGFCTYERGFSEGGRPRQWRGVPGRRGGRLPVRLPARPRAVRPQPPARRPEADRAQQGGF